MLAVTLILFPESARFNFSKERFDDARDNLEVAAHVNGVDYNKNKFKFDIEKELQEERDNPEKIVDKLDAGNEYGVSNR